MASGDPPAVPDGERAGITVYWRPGCAFCSRLMRDLDDAELTYATRNIWEDDAAAAFVRSVAEGNETVPTVAAGGVTLVNPTARDVLTVVTGHSPQHVGRDHEPPRAGLVDRLLTRLLGSARED